VIGGGYIPMDVGVLSPMIGSGTTSLMVGMWFIFSGCDAQESERVVIGG